MVHHDTVVYQYRNLVWIEPELDRVIDSPRYHSVPVPVSHRLLLEGTALLGRGRENANVVLACATARCGTVQADCVCIVYPGVCYRGRRRRCKLTVFL